MTSWTNDPAALNARRVISIGHDQSSVSILQLHGDKPSFIVRDEINNKRIVLDWLDAGALAVELQQLIKEHNEMKRRHAD